MKNFYLKTFAIFMFISVIIAQCDSNNWQDYYPNLQGCQLENADLSSQNMWFGDFTTDIYQTSSIKDVYNWIMSLNMNRSKLIANCFLEEEIDGEVLFDLNYSEVCELFTERNLGRVGLFWLAIFKLKNFFLY